MARLFLNETFPIALKMQEEVQTFAKHLKEVHTPLEVLLLISFHFNKLEDVLPKGHK